MHAFSFKKILSAIFLLATTPLLAQNVNIDTLFKGRSDEQVLSLLKDSFKKYKRKKSVYIFNKNNFIFYEEKYNRCCSIIIEATPFFKLENNDIDKLDFDFIQKIENAVIRFNRLKVIPNASGGFDIIYHYWLTAHETINLIYTFPRKKINNPIIDFSTDYDYYKDARISRIEINTNCPPPDITNSDMMILDKLSYPDSLSKVGKEDEAIHYYKKISREYRSKLSPYTNVHRKLYEIFKKNQNHSEEVREIEYLLAEGHDAEKGYYLQRKCQLLLYSNQFRRLKTACQQALNSRYTERHHKFLSTLYYYVSQIISDRKRAILTQNILIESLDYVGFKGNYSMFKDLEEWVDKQSIDVKKKKKIMDIVNIALSK